MDIKSIAAVMYPYWLLGIFMIWATAKSKYSELVRVEKKGLISFLKFLALINIYRLIMFKLFAHTPYLQEAARNVSFIPWPLTLTVFWEDACHGLPLLLLRKMIGTSKWTWPIHILATLMVMIEFGMGHVYQGILPALLLSLYIPYSIRLGDKHGFGTVMIGHMLWDLTTILSLKLLLGA